MWIWFFSGSRRFGIPGEHFRSPCTILKDQIFKGGGSARDSDDMKERLTEDVHIYGQFDSAVNR